MATTIFPQSGDTAGELPFQHYVRMATEDHVRSPGDMEVTDAGSLDVSIAAGHAILNGVHVHVDSAVTLTVNDNATNYVYLQLSRDASGLVTDPASDSDNYTVTTTTETGDDYLPLAQVIASGGGIDQVNDFRWQVPNGAMGAFKTTNEQRTSTNFQRDGSLILPVPAGRKYLFRATIAFDELPAMKWFITGSTAFQCQVTSLDEAGHDHTETLITNDEEVKFSADTHGVVRWDGYLDSNGSDHDTLDFEWRTHSSSGSAYIRKGSHMKLEPIE